MWIRTTSGPVDCADIGDTTLAHEHLAIDLCRGEDTAAVLNRTDVITAELRACKQEYGLDLVVELSCRGMGRDVARVHEIAAAAGVHAVTATGYYYEAFHGTDLALRSVDDLTADLVEEIATGSDGTTIRPGVLGEIGTHGDEPTPAELVSLTAAGRAALATGLSVATHAHLGRGGLGQLDLLESVGLPPERISIGHQDLWNDSSQHRAIAARGAYVAFDTIGKVSYQSESTRLSLLLELLDAGYERNILLSNDISRESYLHVNGGTGYGHVLGAFRRELAASGVGEDALRLLYRDNVLRFLSAGNDSIRGTRFDRVPA